MLSIWTSLKFCHLVKSKAKLIQIERICKRQLKGGSNDKICSEILSRNMAKNGEKCQFLAFSPFLTIFSQRFPCQ